MITMRSPCACGGLAGEVRPAGGQNCVFCSACRRFQYNAPKSELGQETRRVASRPTIKPGRRMAIIERAGARCELCGRSSARHGVVLHIDHAISLDVGKQAGVADEYLDSDDNLLCLCEECNLGKANGVMSLAIQAAILVARKARNRA